MARNGAPTGSPNADPKLVNALVRHQITASGAERPRVPAQRTPEPPACVCLARPPVQGYTHYIRHTCPSCGRRWEYRASTSKWALVT